MIDKKTEEKLFQMHANVCKSLGSPVRLRILNSLRDGEKSVEEMTKLLGLKIEQALAKAPASYSNVKKLTWAKTQVAKEFRLKQNSR